MGKYSLPVSNELIERNVSTSVVKDLNNEWVKIQTNRLTSDFTVPGATWLQGMGWVYGIPAGDLRVGDLMVWNTGGVSVVSGIVKTTAKQITVMNEWLTSMYGERNETERKMGKDRIVAVSQECYLRWKSQGPEVPTPTE